MEFERPANADEYMRLVRQYCALADQRLQEVETSMSEGGNLMSLAGELPPIVSIVNVVGYLRGQGGGFGAIRPEGVSEHQSELYAVEDAMEARLGKVIGNLCSTDEGALAFERRMEEYYILLRLPMERRDAFMHQFNPPA